MGRLGREDCTALQIGKHPGAHGNLGHGIGCGAWVDDHVAAGEERSPDGLGVGVGGRQQQGHRGKGGDGGE